jgi:hypothetical protein
MTRRLPLLLLALGALVVGCDAVLSPADENLPPNTTLANVPVEGDTLPALLTLHWDGGDADGFVGEYEYRYVTSWPERGDSVAHDWTRTRSTSTTIAFLSPEPYNHQRFEVRAIDNRGAVDPTPAVRRFVTRRSFPPAVEIATPTPGAEYFALEARTDWWRGIPLVFSGSDVDGQVAEYRWSVDGGPETTVRDTSLYLPPSAFGAPLDGPHTIRVVAVDDTGLESAPAEVQVTLVRPAFDRPLLILDETDETNFNAAVRATDADVDAFYARTFGAKVSSYDTWDYNANGGLPPLRELGRYRFVVWHADDRPTNRPHAFAVEERRIQEYLNVGGSIVMSGWRVLKSFAFQANFPLAFPDGSFVKDYLQIGRVDETGILGDMVGTTGVSGFPSLRVDPAKLQFFPNNGRLNNVNLIQERGGFTEVIAAYEPAPDSPTPQYRGTPVALIYYGTSFNAAVVGFPLFFMVEEDVSAFADAILARIGPDAR